MQEASIYEQMNTVLIDTFRIILKMEEQLVKSNGNMNLSISELHLIEAVGINNQIGRTISELAEALDIALSSVTVAVNKLEKKGYVEKRRGEKDARTVFVTLTSRGQKVEHLHSAFHKKMVRSITEDLSDHDQTAMLEGLIKLNDFFKKKLLQKGENR